jgi:hypothetical protein
LSLSQYVRFKVWLSNIKSWKFELMVHDC